MLTHLPLHTARKFKKSEGKPYQHQNLSFSVKDIASKVFGMLDFYNLYTYRKVSLQEIFIDDDI